LKANLISQYHLWAYIGILEREIFVAWYFWGISLALAPIFQALNKRETVKYKCRQKTERWHMAIEMKQNMQICS
jgi:hypothetical protein